MAYVGKNANFYFGTSWGPPDCLQSMDITDNINDIIYQCNGYDRHTIGTRAIGITVSIALSGTEATTMLSYIYPGAESTQAVFRPMGHSTASDQQRLKYSATKTLCVRGDIGAPINGMVTADYAFVLDDVTIAAATT